MKRTWNDFERLPESERGDVLRSRSAAVHAYARRSAWFVSIVTCRGTEYRTSGFMYALFSIENGKLHAEPGAR